MDNITAEAASHLMESVAVIEKFVVIEIFAVQGWRKMKDSGCAKRYCDLRRSTRGQNPQAAMNYIH
ncbi:hypothetical protein [Pectobacterium polaris]|uniref:hypothetical protein n=1 Tax=Pectobacterium polaris TaxID=2042057 RepID=UPI001584157B|nr:hypothetical protein [Pectobacterium polaris]